MFTAIGRMVVGVPDQEEALAFYRDVLGFEVVHDEDAEGFRYLHLALPGQTAPGVWLMPGSPESDRPLLVLYTDDLAGVVAGLDRAGVEVWARTERSLHFRDIAGNVIVAAAP